MATVPVTPVVAEPVTAPKENFIEKIEDKLKGDEKKISTFLSMIGKDANKSLVAVETYLPSVENLAKIVFPAQTAVITNAVNITQLVTNTVATIEAKYAASGAASKTGPQKLADALEIAGPATIAMLKQDGVTANTDTVTQIINKVVSILNLPLISGLTPAAPSAS